MFIRDSLSLHIASAISIAAATYDLRTGRIPDAITLPALAIGLSVGSPAGAVFAAAPALWLFWRLKLGGGDVKLLAALGALLGPRRGLLVEALAIGGALATGSHRLGPWIAGATIACSVAARRG